MDCIEMKSKTWKKKKKKSTHQYIENALDFACDRSYLSPHPPNLPKSQKHYRAAGWQILSTRDTLTLCLFI